MDLSNNRKTYNKNYLSEEDIDKNPYMQFDLWMKEALDSDISEPYAMTLATSDTENTPSARTVLLRYYDESGLIFYTNYNSKKGQDLKNNPKAALLFFWSALERQIRIQGLVEKVSDEISDQYWEKRPELSRLASKSSPQSQIISSADELSERMEAMKKADDLARPEHWGGYILKPQKFEFWQGRPGRMHDRISYEAKADASWDINRLAP